MSLASEWLKKGCRSVSYVNSGHFLLVFDSWRPPCSGPSRRTQTGQNYYNLSNLQWPGSFSKVLGGAARKFGSALIEELETACLRASNYCEKAEKEAIFNQVRPTFFMPFMICLLHWSWGDSQQPCSCSAEQTKWEKVKTCLLLLSVMVKKQNKKTLPRV